MASIAWPQMMIGSMGADTQIALDANNRVILVGISDPSVLQASDFISVG